MPDNDATSRAPTAVQKMQLNIRRRAKPVMTLDQLKNRIRKSQVKSVPNGSADYVGWRGTLLAKLSLSRLKDANIYENPAGQHFDYLVNIGRGLCFFVAVNAFSSIHRGLPDVASFEDLPWQMERRLLDQARKCQSPVVLFLFDADTEHGRFLRLDNVFVPSGNGKFVTLDLPIANTITGRSLERLIRELSETTRSR